MTDKIKVGIIGATGYGGVELIRILLNHPHADIEAISSISFEGKNINTLYGAFNEIIEDKLVPQDEVIARCDVIFAAVPHGICEEIGRKCVDSGKKLIDLGADFRLTDEAAYKEWYGLDYNDKALHELSVYCIPELHRQNYKENTQIVGNPGCYPTSIGLGLAPLAIKNYIDVNSIIIDAKSGVTGAGRGLAQNTHYPECNENFAPYKVAEHRHTPEIEQTLSGLSGKDVTVTFVPHLLPVNRGIISTIYATVTTDISLEEIHALYKDFYKDEKFVRVLDLGKFASLKGVTYSNYCDISIHFDKRTSRVIIVSTIDNMVKGAAGQAIQNMNILFNIDEKAGLNLIPPAI